MYIHHFTSIKSLAYILAKKSFKFSRFDKLNDPKDGISNEYQHAQKLAFVLCFTKREDDSIPMWSMYTKNFDGIRLSFPDTLFGSWTQRGNYNMISIPQNPLNQKSPFLIGPIDVNYKRTEEEINHSIIKYCKNYSKPIKGNNQENGMEFNPWDIGIYKLEDWSFEDEIRFLFPAIDFQFSTVSEDLFHNEMRNIESLIINLPEFIYINFDESLFSKMKVLLGPKTEKADCYIVRSLLREYAKGFNFNNLSKSSKQIH